MIRRILLLGCFLVLLPAAVQAGPVMVISEPKIVLEDPIIQGGTAEGVFVVTNPGDQELIIESVRPGCGCTVASHDQTVPPGGEGKVTLEFKTDGYSGKNTKSALVRSNDAEHPQQMIFLTVDITPVIAHDPETLVLKTKIGEPQSASMLLTVNIPEPVIVRGIGHSFGELARIELETVEPGKKYRVTLKTEAQQAIQWRGRILLDLKDAPLPRLSLPAFLDIGAE